MGLGRKLCICETIHGRVEYLGLKEPLRNHDFVIPRLRTVAYGKHSLTYLGPVIWSIRLNHWTFSKSVLNWLISQACWKALVKTVFM